MKNFGAKWLSLAAVLGAVAGMSLNGCGDGGGGTARGGTTGTGGRGGTTGTAGSTAGTTGRGGTTGAAGATSTAGTTGTAGRGGTTGTAGATAGTTGTGGGAGNGGLPCPGLATFDVANDLQGFALNSFMDTTAGAAVNLAVREGGARATIAQNGTEGDPSAGSLRVDAPFDDYGQFVDIQHNFGSTMLQNWTGFKLHVRVKVASGLNPTTMNPAGVQAYVNTGTSYSFCGPFVTVVAGNGWNDYVLNLGACTGIDPSMVIAYGVSIQSASGSNGDGGVNTMKPTTAVIYVDSFWLEGSCGGTGGTGGGTAGTTGTGGGTAGTTGTGGGTAGTTGTGGGTAGTTGTGGGTAGTGGGTAGTGGTGGGNTDGGTTAAALYYTFDSTAQGWALGTSGTGNIAAIEGGTPPTATWDSAVGNPSPPNGSLKVTGTFTAYNQILQVNTGIISPALDLSNKTVHVWVRLDAGAAGTGFSGGVQLQFLSTPGVYTFGQNNSQYVTLTAGTWTELTADMAVVKSMYAAFDPSQIIEVQVQFLTGGAPEGGTFTTTSPTFHIDTVTDGGSSAPPPLSHTFDTTAQGYTLSTSIPDAGTAPVLSFDGTTGDPAPGSLKVVASFTAYNQDFDVTANINPLANITGKMVHVRVKLDSGTLPAGFVQFHISSTTNYRYASTYVGSVSSGTYADIVFDPATITDTMWHADQIIQLGVKIGTASGPEGGAFTATGPLTFHIDSIVAQ